MAVRALEEFARLLDRLEARLKLIEDWQRAFDLAADERYRRELAEAECEKRDSATVH